MSKPRHEFPTDEVVLKAIDSRYEQLDREHARATSPSQRQAIESKMQENRRERQKHIDASKKVDEAFEKWSKSMDTFDDELEQNAEEYLEKNSKLH